MYSRLWVGLRGRFFPKPTCGENPVLWKEIHTCRVPGTAEVLGVLVAVALVGLIGWGTYHFGRPAFVELTRQGFGSSGADGRRAQFNRFLSHVSSWVEFVLLLIVAGVAAASVTVERACDTWDSLIATPLDGREIARQDARDGLEGSLGGPTLLLVLLSGRLGPSLAGSLHPIGLVAAVVVLSVSIWFMIALGTYASLTSRDTAAASNRALIPALLLSGSFLACYLPNKISTVVFMGVGSAPVRQPGCAWFSDGEIREVLSGEPTFRRLEEMNIYTYESGLRVLAACLISIAAFAAAAVCLSRAAISTDLTGSSAAPSGGMTGGMIALPLPQLLRRGEERRKRVVLMVVSFVVLLLITLVVWSEEYAARCCARPWRRPTGFVPAGVWMTWKRRGSECRMRRTPPCASLVRPIFFRRSGEAQALRPPRPSERNSMHSPRCRRWSDFRLQGSNRCRRRFNWRVRPWPKHAGWQTCRRAGSRSDGPATGYPLRFCILQEFARSATCYLARRFSSQRRERRTDRS